MKLQGTVQSKIMASLVHMVTTPHNEFVNALPCAMSSHNTSYTDNSDINNNYNDESDDTDNSRTDRPGDRNGNQNNNDSSSNNSERNDQQESGDGAGTNNNSGGNPGGNDNNNGGGNDKGDSENHNEREGEEEVVDEEDDENNEEEVVNGSNSRTDQGDHIKQYLLHKLSMDVEDKANGKMGVNSLSIVSNTPYDSIEAQSRYNDIDQKKSNSLVSDEFSGTESMEYIHYNDHKAIDPEKWYPSLSEDSISCQLPNSEVNVITGNDTLSAVICLEEGLADDDSWVEELDHNDDNLEESSDSEEFAFVEERHYNRTIAAAPCDIDLTLHTIFEESGEESGHEEVEERTKPTQLEKYFVFELSGGSAAQDADSISESSSTLSEGAEPPLTPTAKKQKSDGVESPPSRLEKYFLSGFMGFHERDSDSSVGSDSEGTQSPEQRRKKVVGRARGTNRHSSSLDNLTEDQHPLDSQGQYQGSDPDVNREDNSFEKMDGQFDTVKRTKKKKHSLPVPSTEHLDSCEMEAEQPEVVLASQAVEKPPVEVKATADLPIANKAGRGDSAVAGSLKSADAIKNFLPATPCGGLSRKDSFNNWSSDEETNLMMSKMRTFFKNMLAQRKNASLAAKSGGQPLQLAYFESELTRLMKTVPGLREDQVKEIVEYLSSEDTWSDSCDSSDYASSDMEVGTSGKNLFMSTPADGSKNDSDLVYHCLMSSFQCAKTNGDSSPPLMTKVMQHIGTRLVALMHDVSEGTTTTPKTGRYQRRLQHTKLATAAEEDDDSPEERSPLPRSKSYDPLLEESRQEASDNERFSWRGSFESALMTGSDSRTRLPSAGENSASALAIAAAAAAKRRSAGDLLLKSANNSREHLDRVRSCGSIGGGIEDKIWSMRHTPRNRRSSVPEGGSNSGESADGENDSEDDVRHHQHQHNVLQKPANDTTPAKSTTLPRTLHNFSTSTTNSLPRLSSLPNNNVICIVNNSQQQQQQQHQQQQQQQQQQQAGVKSARYRPPGYNLRDSVSSYHTMCAPPRRDYNNRRRHTHHAVTSLAVSSTGMGTGDDCSVSSNISERTGILDNESEKSHSRISTVSVTRSDSMASVYSGAGEGRYGVVPVRGWVEFSLQYNYKAGDVEVHVKRCCDLAPVDTKRNRSDPYVKVYLLPDKSKSGKRKTRIKKHTLNPVFDEVLKYHITLQELESKTLWLSVWHSDIFGRNNFLGEVTVPLVNKVFDDLSPKVYVLKERSEVLDNVSNLRGELIVALKFLLSADTKAKKRGKQTGSLQVLIKEAKNLIAAKSNGSSDPFCKGYLLPNKGRSCKQKTSVLKRTCHPVWNHTFAYTNVTLDELSERCIELTIWDHDRIASNEFLGGVRLSLGTGVHNNKSVDWMDSNNREVALWQKMMDHPNFWVESSLILRPSLDARHNKN